MNVSEEESDSKTEEERFRRETRKKKKKRQERTEKGLSSGSMTQLMEMIASLQISTNTRFDALDDKISDIQERVMRLEAILLEAKDLGDQGKIKEKRSSH
ncbi:hypothetical protein M9H77_27408 [Catharanthus roseus]|uniref:Uncharacterized protein n=1 Tax=Catharanthus roseus TaxID=4058 RepID=A0ACC0ACL6_CATRO|nr:hypothetical protein M9H77_27408 [Catharanthus roseus]